MDRGKGMNEEGAPGYERWRPQTDNTSQALILVLFALDKRAAGYFPTVGRGYTQDIQPFDVR